MKRLSLVVPLFAVIAFSAASAPVLFLNPSSQVSGSPGQTVGWDFTLSNSTDYAVVNSFAFVPLGAAIGTFTDFSQYNFIDVGPAPSESPTLIQLFTAANHTGIGRLLLSPAATAGTTTGSIVMTYDLYATDPASGSGTPISFGNTLSVPASIVVTAAPTPEPATFALLLCGTVFLIGRRWRSNAR